MLVLYIESVKKIYTTNLDMELMNKAIIAGLAAGVLVVGLIFSPLVNGLQFDAQVASAADTGQTKQVTLVASEKQVQIAPVGDLHPSGIMYSAMVFNGTIPGPVIAVNQGDTLEITLKNEGKIIHSLDFHAGIGPSNALSGNVGPGESKTWTLHAKNAGAFLYHCGADGLNGVWEHIANGMYGGIVVHAQKEKPAKEFYVVMSEIYNNNSSGPFGDAVNATTVGSFDITKFAGDADLKLTNGEAFKYAPAIGKSVPIVLNKELNKELAAGDLSNFLKVKPGELTRWYIVNPGPNGYVAFHFIAGQMDTRDGSIMGNYGRQWANDETWTIPPGSASTFEATFPEEGIYVGVDHNMNHVLRGAAFAVVATNGSTADDIPPEAKVPAKNSASATTRHDFDIADYGVKGDKIWMSVNGVAGGTTPTSMSDIYAYVFVTDKGIYAVTSHGAEDSPQVQNDLIWHTHKVELDSNSCISKIESTADVAGTAMVSGNTVAINGSGASSIDQTMAVKLTIGDKNICVSGAFDMLKK
jgi:nitrite reductase (NO-forming)